jgi:hypothetical protein
MLLNKEHIFILTILLFLHQFMWKSLGDGYTAAMARMLEDAENHPEILKKII